MAKFKTHKSGFVAVLALLAVAVIITYAYAALKTETNQVTYTDHQRFRSKVTFDAPGPAQPAQIYFGANSEINYQSGSDGEYESGSGVTFSGIRVENTTMQNFKNPTIVALSGTSYYDISKSNGSYFWIDDYKSTLGTRVASGVSIRLPTITSAYHGYTVKIMKMPGLYNVTQQSGATIFSGTTKVVITTYPWATGTTDCIWNVTTGTTNESSGKVSPEVSEMDAAGDWLEFTAHYNASGSTWYQTGRYIQ